MSIGVPGGPRDGRRPEAPALAVRRAVAGDPAAFGDLYSQFYEPIRVHLARSLGNADDAQEGAQEVFRKALEARRMATLPR